MCGVSGIVSSSIQEAPMRAALDGMNRVQRHRGPDDSAVLSRGEVGMAFNRLAILDLTTGMQPVTAREDGVTIACNGQVYNYIELKAMLPGQRYQTTGDMEVALHLYRSLGPGFLNHLNGMFAGVIHDPVRRRLLLFRDRFGIKPMHYTVNRSGFFFASEIPALLSLPWVSKEPDFSLLPVFFTYRYLPGERTIYRHILRLPPGSWLELDLDTGDYRIDRYWSYDFREPERYTDPVQASEEFIRLFRDAVRLRLRSDVEVGSFLSGGIDSSAVASLTAAIKPDLKLFTVTFDEEGYDEGPGVDEFVASMGGRFNGAETYLDKCRRDSLASLPGIVKALGEPLSLGAVIPTDRVCALASRRVKVVLTGEGADEVFAGYRKFLVEAAFIAHGSASSEERIRLEKLYPEIENRLREGNIGAVRRHIATEALFTRPELERLLGRTWDTHDFFPPDALPEMDPGIHPVKAMQAIECRSRLPDYVAARLDRLSMRHSLEARTPFLDYRLAEFAASLPVDMKVRPLQGLEKYICRRAFADGGVLPPHTALRPKKPFTMPMAHWFENPSSLPGELKEIALGTQVDRQGILDGSMVRELASGITGKGVGPETLVSGVDRFFAALVFTLWYRECIEKR